MASSNLHSFTVQEALNKQTAGGGYELVSNATVNSNTYCAITILTGSVDDGKNSTCAVTATSTDTDIWDTLTAIAVPVGTTIYGNWSAVTIPASNTAIVYKNDSTSS
jgi:hypothetical protein